MPATSVEQLQALPYGIVALHVTSGRPVYANATALETLSVTTLDAMGRWSISCRPDVVDPPLFDAVAIVEITDQPRVRLQGTWVPLPLNDISDSDALALFVLHLTPLVHPWRQMLKEIAAMDSALPLLAAPAPAENLRPTAKCHHNLDEHDERLLWERARFAALTWAIEQGPRAVLLWDAESGVVNYASENIEKWGLSAPIYMDEWLKLVHQDDLPELKGGRARLSNPDADITVWSYRIRGNDDAILTIGEHSRRVPAPDNIALVCTTLENRTLPTARRNIDPLRESRGGTRR
ncbi:MAG: hypothetical protein FWE06_02290 [Oscillospiraceae bacterium]|nr:hypothetical protein [Oscillospiraceae bacterium]